MFRRATAQCEGFGNFDKALDDLKKARELAPDDKAIEQMYKKALIAVRKTEKAADRKMNGFLKDTAKDGEGLFDDSLRPTNTEGPKLPSEPVKVRDGLFLMPKEEEKKKDTLSALASGEIGEDEINYEELTRELNEMKEDQPEVYLQMKEKMKEILEREAKAADEEDENGEEPAGDLIKGA